LLPSSSSSRSFFSHNARIALTWALACACLFLCYSRVPPVIERVIYRYASGGGGGGSGGSGGSGDGGGEGTAATTSLPLRQHSHRRRSFKSTTTSFRHMPVYSKKKKSQEPPIPPPCLVWTLLYGPEADARGISSVNYQYYLLESLRQARIFNPGIEFFVLTDDPDTLDLERASWSILFASPHINATLIDVRLLRDWELIHIESRFRDVWGPLAHLLGNFMMPSLSGGTNWAFTVITLTRLIYVHHWGRRYRNDGGIIIHVENDQMIYGHVNELAASAMTCHVDFILGRVAKQRTAAAVLYLSSYTALRPLLDFLWNTLSHGAGHAESVTGTQWVTDMSLTSAYIDAAGLNNNNVTLWPLSTVPSASSCLSNHLPVVIDAAALGTWCCGDMGRGKELFKIKSEFSDFPLWESLLEWVILPIPYAIPPYEDAGEIKFINIMMEGGEGDWSVTNGPEWDEERSLAAKKRRGQRAPLLRVPVWNGTRVWNLHMHSKMLHWWRSDDDGVEKLWENAATAGECGEMC
jgi:hypothetical protein